MPRCSLIREACKRLGTENLSGREVYYASPDGIVSVVTREGYPRYYSDDQRHFEFDTSYEEFSRPWQDRRLPMAHRPDAEGLEVYERWRRLNP